MTTPLVADPFDVVVGPRVDPIGPRSLTADWMDDASCRDSGLEFVIEERGPAAGENLALRLAVCSDCPVKRECLEYAFEQPSSIAYGVYGGTAGFQRRTAQHLPNRIELLLGEA